MSIRYFKLTSSILVLVFSFCFNYTGSFTGSEEIISKKSVYRFKEIKLFDFVTTDLNQKNTESIISQGTILKLNTFAKVSLLNSRTANIVLKVPLSETDFMELELVKSNVTADDFKCAAISADGSINFVNYETGLHYRGILNGDDNSWAALSIFDEFVIGVIASSDGNFNIGVIDRKVDVKESDYILFNDKNVIAKNNFLCLTPDGGKIEQYKIFHNPGINRDLLTQYPIKQYIECDYKMYQDFGSNVSRVNNFVSAVFNSIIAVYQAEQIGMVLQSTYIWTSPDIYANTNSLPTMLKRFGSRIKNNFNGHLGTLISTRTNTGGGYAWVDVLCGSYSQWDSSGPYAVCIIDTNYRAYPVYSWIINVMTHEMGHNIGSRHTHSCMWPGGPIDTCYHVEGGCYNGPLKPRVGTIMSYCHINGGVNLAFGFGPLPGNLIRQRFINAPCLIGIQQISSEVPQNFEIMQNYPNPFNPKTTIRFKVAAYGLVKLIIFDALGREIEELVNEPLQPGTYEADFDGTEYPSGVYYYELKSNDFSGTKKMVIIK